MRPYITFVTTVCSRFALLFALTALWLPAWPATNVSGAISVDTVWDDPVYVVTGSVSVIAEVTLTIQPGTVIKFNGARVLDIQGQLLAEGTEAEPIHFSDVRDDTVGGDTNGDDDATAPAAGWWRGIQPRDAGSATLAHVSVRYAGHRSSAGSGQAGIWHRGTGALSVTDSVVLDSARYGIFIENSTAAHSITATRLLNNGLDGIRATGAATGLQIVANRIEGSGGNGITLVDLGMPVSVSGNQVQANGAHGIEIQNSEGDFHRNVVRGNSISGFRIAGASATPHLRRNVVMFNPIGIDVGTGADPLIGGSAEDGNDLAANAEFSVRNSDSSLTINARFNWWGDPSGPFHPEDNPGGLGNEVSDWVDFSDFLDESTYDRVFRDRFEALDNTGA